MMSFFTNGFAMAAGTLLISSPIIIHLINRMRYRRIHWAAMEFLLKSQKKNRRRVIIEQIILLLLRILLVLLAGLLMARFIGGVGGQRQSTLHVLLLDDTPSMADFEMQDGRKADAFGVAKKVIIDEIGQFAAQATTPQSLTLIRMSDPDNPRVIERLNSSTVEELRTYLADLEPSPLHIEPIRGLRAAEAVLNTSKEDRRLLHIVGDFRTNDWTGGPSDALRLAVDQFRAMKVDVHLIDTALPATGDNVKIPQYHDNLAIVDFQPETRVVARNAQVEFSVAVANYSAAEKKNVRVTVRVKGQDRAEGSFTINTIGAHSTSVGTFQIAFDQLGHSPVSVNLENEEAGLAIDNVRHTVVEVRDRVPILMVEGDLKTKGTTDGDGYFLQQLFAESTRGFDVHMRVPNDLEKINLEQYPSILLLNVPRLTDKATKALERYIRQGGGVAFYLGGEAKPDYYNKLYDEGKGIFPVPIADKAVDPSSIEDRLKRQFGAGLGPKIYARNEEHPILSPIYRDEKTRGKSRENNKHLAFASVDRYWPVVRSLWRPQRGQSEELMTLPNRRLIADYADQVNKIVEAITAAGEKYPKFKPRFEAHKSVLKTTLTTGGELFNLVGPLDALLNETGSPEDPAKPNLQEFWQASDQLELRDQLAKLLETVRYGDPFLVVKTVDKGRVLAYLTTPNSDWNDLPSGLSRIYWVMLTLEMQKYLGRNTADVNLVLGTPIELDLDATRYNSSVQQYLPPKIDYGKGGLIDYKRVDAGKTDGVVNGARLIFNYAGARMPGVYEFELTRKDVDAPPMGPAPKPDVPKALETLAFAYNVDAQAESNLRRAGAEDLSIVMGTNVQLHRPGDPVLESLLKDKKSDFSESPWLYLFVLLVLIVEQAMAVRLSFHNQGADTLPTYSSATAVAPAAASMGAEAVPAA